jgi:hypothetical protein
MHAAGTRDQIDGGTGITPYLWTSLMKGGETVETVQYWNFNYLTGLQRCWSAPVKRFAAG